MSAAALRAVAASSCGTVAARLAERAANSLMLELDTWPKPGLVSHMDRGSHRDMDAGMLMRSSAALQPFFGEFALAGACAADMSTLRRIGLRAEHAMLQATRGVNAHRGALFGLGLLCAAAGWRATHAPTRAPTHAPVRASLGAIVAANWGADILTASPRGTSVRTRSHGEQAARRYGAGGAREEAANGFPHVYETGLSALQWADARGAAPEAARVHTCFALIAAVTDTNLLHRGGPAGLGFARAAAAAFLAGGSIARADWRLHAAAVHHDFVAQGLSPGGSADLLAMTLFVAASESDP